MHADHIDVDKLKILTLICMLIIWMYIDLNFSRNIKNFFKKKSMF